MHSIISLMKAKRTKEQEQADEELITVILPIVGSQQ